MFCNDMRGMTDIDHMLRRLVLRSRNVFFAQLLRPPLVCLVLLEFSTLADDALLLFDRKWPEPVCHIRKEASLSRAREGGGEART